MKKYFFFAVALALSACTSDEYMGGVNPGEADGAIKFTSATGAMSRAEHTGADAAGLLNHKFIVAGFKGAQSTNGVVTIPVFDHYIVNWKQNTAGTTESNTADWEYVGVTAAAPATVTGEQTIKYWDYGTGQYDFVAFSTGTATVVTEDASYSQGTNVLISAVAPSTATTSAYTIMGASADLAKCYIADLVTAYNPAETGKPVYGNEVQLKFRNLAAKARVALYETIPGYSVKDVHFYQDGTTLDANNETITETSATLFAPAGSTATDNFYTAGTATVYFPTVGTSNVANSDYNKAHVNIAATSSSKTQAFGNLQYKASDDSRLSGSNIFLGTNSANPSYAGTTSPYYTTILPNETGTTLTLRVNYTLVSNDGSGETINVYGATAVVPSKYCQWKSNYAYTYIFKISDNTNGLTGLDFTDKVGLYPITFDAVVADPTDGNQETVTTVATPSITTYSPGVQPTANNEYKQNSWIYVMVMNEGSIQTISAEHPCAIYKMEKDATEAEVMDALNMVESKDGEKITGRNKLVLDPKNIAANFTTIPGVDGNNITITAGDAALFKAEETGSYAVVYGVAAGVPTTYNSAISWESEPENWETIRANLYTDFEMTQSASDFNAKKVYYQKLTNNNNVYAIKVVKVVS